MNNTPETDFAIVIPGEETKPVFPDWLGEAPDYSKSKFAEELETDVVVCGAGIAGVAASRAAVEAGSEVILLEKSSRLQARSGQFAVIGGQTMARWGMHNIISPEEAADVLMRESSYRADQRILRYFTEHIGEDFDWYLEGAPEGIHFQNNTTDPLPENIKQYILLMQHPPSPHYCLHRETYPCWPLTVQIRPGHGFVLAGNHALASANGHLKSIFDISARRLLREGNGPVHGVIAQREDGDLLCIHARKGVVLATGSYAGDRAMLRYYCPWLCENPVVPCGVGKDKKPLDTGDGHKMGLWAGAKMENVPHGGMAHNLGAAMGLAPFLLLDADGNRFMNENCPGQQMENRLARLKNGMAWQVFDADWPVQIPYMPAGHCAPSCVVDMRDFAAGKVLRDLVPMDGYASQWWLQSTIDRGQTVYADTLEELFLKMGVPVKTAAASIARYNALAQGGADLDFGKPASRMFALQKPPFYASRLERARLLGTISGLESDAQAHVLDHAMRVIPGLYAAGNVQGNRFGDEYPVSMPGLSHSMALTFGRAAGRNAAQGL